ncbi:MAG: hypothetical protein ACXAC8_11445 [Candidatus Hodarchaeales archaeon]
MTNRNIRVKFLQDFPGFSFENIKIPSSQKGSQIEVPYFIAKIFREESVIDKFQSNFPLNLQELTGALRNEMRIGSLQPIPPYFYTLIKELVETDEEKESQYSEIEQKRLKSKLNQLINERVSKIIKMTDSKEIRSRKSNLTSSEQILFKKIHEMIQIWKAEFIQQ